LEAHPNLVAAYDSLRGHREIGACSVAISSDGRLVASGGWDGTVRWYMQE
jgi:hypothetical protein